MRSLPDGRVAVLSLLYLHPDWSGRRTWNRPTYIPRRGINQVKHDIAAVNGDVSTLQGLGATPGTDPSGALAAGNKALSDAASAITTSQNEGNAIDGQAHQLMIAADNYDTSHCGYVARKTLRIMRNRNTIERKPQ
jgi:hypothetical protein